MRTTRPRCQASTFAAAAPVGGRQPRAHRHAPHTTACSAASRRRSGNPRATRAALHWCRPFHPWPCPA
eukprot:12867634-Prorocentrum_lima.AAC.1